MDPRYDMALRVSSCPNPPGMDDDYMTRPALYSFFSFICLVEFVWTLVSELCSDILPLLQGLEVAAQRRELGHAGDLEAGGAQKQINIRFVA